MSFNINLSTDFITDLETLAVPAKTSIKEFETFSSFLIDVIIHSVNLALLPMYLLLSIFNLLFKSRFGRVFIGLPWINLSSATNNASIPNFSFWTSLIILSLSQNFIISFSSQLYILESVINWSLVGNLFSFSILLNVVKSILLIVLTSCKEILLSSLKFLKNKPIVSILFFVKFCQI